MPLGLTEQQLFIFLSSDWPENLFCGRVQVAVLRSTFISSSFWMAGLVLASEERFSSPEIPPFSFYLLLLFFVEKLPDYCILKHSKYSVFFFFVSLSLPSSFSPLGSCLSTGTARPTDCGYFCTAHILTIE